jgi:hypothetical protein
MPSGGADAAEPLATVLVVECLTAIDAVHLEHD